MTISNQANDMLLFEIHMIPKPQKQTQFGKRICWDPSKQVKQQIQWQIRPHAPKEPIKGPVHVYVTFYLPIPNGTSSLKRNQMVNGTCFPVKRPDLDNMAYLVTNAMKEIVYEDDSQIVDLSLSKRFGEEPKFVVKVVPICE